VKAEHYGSEVLMGSRIVENELDKKMTTGKDTLRTGKWYKAEILEVNR